MKNPVILKLSHPIDLTDEDRAELERLTARPRPVAARTDLICQGDRPETVRVVMRGIACRYHTLPDGGRQIVALLIPGDLCDMHVAILGEMDHSLATLSACDIVEIPRATVRQITETNPRITHALWWATLVDEAVLRHWLVNNGRRQADHQLLHLLCELLVRFEAVGLAEGGRYPFPVTQEELGDILGLSTVHAHRTLQWLRAEGLVAFEKGQVTILDRTRAWEMVNFDPAYLHLTRRS